MKQELADHAEEELAQIQDEMRNTSKWLNKHSDFSVQPKPTHYEACGNMASLKLQGDSNLKEEAAALLKIEEAADSLRCDERTIRYYLFEAKSLPYLKLGKEARIRESDLSGFIENRLEGQSSSNKELL